MAKISFLKTTLSLEVPSGSTFLNTAEGHPSLPIQFGCRRGICGKCAIEVVEGKENLTKCDAQETETLKAKGLSSQHRLACQCAINGNVTIT